MTATAELHVARHAGAATPAASGAKVTPIIPHEKLQQLYDLMLQYQLADVALRQAFTRKRWSLKQLPSLKTPAVCAGLFAQLRAGDCVGAARYAFAANLAAGAPLACILQGEIARAGAQKPTRKRAVLQPAAELAAITGAALAQRSPGETNVVIAFPTREFWREDKAAAAVLRWAAGKHLPVLYVTVAEQHVARDLPKAGDSQSEFGLPQIAVDADDVVAVYRVADECMLRARSGVGPSWIQCVVPEKTADRQPLALMQKFLEARGLFEASRKAQTTKMWRDHWKKAWQVALRGSMETTPELPIAAWSALD